MENYCVGFPEIRSVQHLPRIAQEYSVEWKETEIPSSEGILQVFSGHIQKGSKLIHDGEAAHNDLVNHLHLKEEVYLTEETSGLDDAENPLNRINHVHALLAWFLGSHSSFMRENLNGYLNLFALIMNPPHNKLEKVELFLEMAINTHVSLKYRDFYKKPSDEEESG